MVGDHIDRFKENDLVLIGPNLPHEWLCDQKYFKEDGGFLGDGIVIQFLYQFLGKKFFDLPENFILKNVLANSLRGIEIADESKNRIKHYMLQMLEQGSSERLYSLFMIFKALTDSEELDAYKSDIEKEGFSLETTLDASDIPGQCNLIVCTTPSKSPVLQNRDIRIGTHITAMGSDTAEKQELDPLILKNADLLVADSIEQCLDRGEIYKAITAGELKKEGLIELGNIIGGKEKGRTSDQQTTVADLTGVAVQDINIASAVFRAFTS